MRADVALARALAPALARTTGVPRPLAREMADAVRLRVPPAELALRAAAFLVAASRPGALLPPALREQAIGAVLRPALIAPAVRRAYVDVSRRAPQAS